MNRPGEPTWPVAPAVPKLAFVAVAVGVVHCALSARQIVFELADQHGPIGKPKSALAASQSVRKLSLELLPAREDFGALALLDPACELAGVLALSGEVQQLCVSLATAVDPIPVVNVSVGIRKDSFAVLFACGEGAVVALLRVAQVDSRTAKQAGLPPAEVDVSALIVADSVAWG